MSLSLVIAWGIFISVGAMIGLALFAIIADYFANLDSEQQALIITLIGGLLFFGSGLYLANHYFSPIKQTTQVEKVEK
jgi:hypothetical protein